MKHPLVLVLLSLFLASCAGTLPYPPDYPLSSEMFRSRDGSLSGRVPQGWVFSSEDTLAPALVAWLVKEDFSASLSLEEIHLDRLSAERVDSEGLELLARMSLQFQQGPAAAQFTEPPVEFKLGGTRFCGYEIIVKGERKRIVVFAARGRFYECSAAPLKGVWSDEELTRLFAAQQGLLSSITF